MTLTQITYFEAVCKHKNVTKAAEALFVSRSAVSRSLKDLENEWKLTLFTRSRTGVELTEDGAMLRSMFREFNTAYTALKKYKNDSNRLAKTPELRIGITATTGSRFFPDFFPKFKELHPDIQLRFRECFMHEILDALNNGDLDFFITPHLNDDLERSDTIEKIRIYDSEMVFCISKAHELAKFPKIPMEKVTDLKRASLSTPMSPDILDNKFSGSLIDYEDSDTIIKTSQQELIRKAVSCGFATAILPKEIVEKWEGVAALSFDPIRKISVYIVWNKNLMYSEVCKKFLNYIRKYDFTEF